MENLNCMRPTQRPIFENFLLKPNIFAVKFKLFALALRNCNKPIGITGNNALELANQSMDYIGHKHKLYSDA